MRVITSGNIICWYDKIGRQHRLDGPAREFPSGRKEWWIYGKQLKEEQFNSKLYRLLYT